ncbi:MAG: discoidin domain-containing protein [Clostridia bacterium]|nr:discoidin domain-containing protein [Clostridia bacterium]
MKKFISIVLAGIMCTGAIPAIAMEADNVTENIIYVSQTGLDTNEGSFEKPVQSLNVARDMAREMEGEVEIVLRGGEYVLEETLTLDKRDSNVKWKSYEGEIAIVTSARDITDWTIHDEEKNIYKAELEEGFMTRQVYFNGEKAKRSRSISYKGGYSNLDRTCELGLRSRNSREFYFYRNEVDNWNNFEDVEIHLLSAWVDNVFRLKKYDGEKNFSETTVDNGGSEGVVSAAAVKIQDIEAERIFNRAHPDLTGTTRGYASRSYYYFENAYEFIDEDLEWYIDKHTDTIYFKAPSGVDMNKARITVPTLETLINIEGDKENKAENITFENITFECTTWTLPGEEGLVGAQACQYTLTTTLDNKTTVYHIPAGFYATYADNLLVKGCTFRKMGAMGLDYYEGVTNSNIFENEVYDVAATGISIAKFVQDEKTEYHTAYNPSDKREITKNINVINNKVHHIGTEYEGAVGIAAGYPEHIIIAHNDIHNVPYSGISVGFGWSDADNAMKHNMIFANKLVSLGEVLCDFGGIYTLSKQPGSVCARNFMDNIKRKAWFDYAYAAMYFDEQTEGYVIEDNLLVNIGSDAWGGGINFNGCKSKNTLRTNYVNKPIDTNETTLAVYNEAGVQSVESDVLVKEAEEYLDKIINPEEPYDEADYMVHREIMPIKATATRADSGSDASYAIDRNGNTSYKLSGQTAESAKNEYLLIELDGKSVVDSIVIDKEYHAGGINEYDYWADWCMAVGCELQGSVDGTTWKTIGVMNTWPDGVTEPESEVFNLAEPMAYKYIRYIRTTVKKSGDYGYWLWSSSDGGNRLNIKEISFFGSVPSTRLEPINVTATGCDEDSDPSYATDGNHKTVYTLSNQTADSMKDEYLLLELDGKRTVDKIIIRRQFNAANGTVNNYWYDWGLAVGCELQGSFDGEQWETIAVMNTWPDGKGETTKEVFELQKPAKYKYVRYIRTKYKTGSDYLVWLWKNTDGGNRLNVKEIELYSAQRPGISSVNEEGKEIKVELENVFEAKGVLCVAFYNEDELLNAETKMVEEGKTEYYFKKADGAKKIKAMIIDLEKAEPLCECKIASEEEIK